MQAGERVRYRQAFLDGLENKVLRRTLASMEGTILAIDGDQAQVDFGLQFRATSVVKLDALEKVRKEI